MKIIKYPNKILRTKLETFNNFQMPNLRKIVNEMKETMKNSDGVGLAANQVNETIRLITINTKDGAMAFFNPRIIKKSILKTSSEEGCLSFPGINGYVNRNSRILVEYEDELGNTKTIKANGLMSIVFQHEIDHINGILFIDKIKKYTEGKELLENLKKQAKNDEI